MSKKITSWKVNGEWRHKLTSRLITIHTLVVNFGEDPIKTITELEDFSGMEYERGTIEKINPPYVIHTHKQLND